MLSNRGWLDDCNSEFEEIGVLRLRDVSGGVMLICRWSNDWWGWGMGWDDVWIDARPTIDEGLKGRSVGGGSEKWYELVCRIEVDVGRISCCGSVRWIPHDGIDSMSAPRCSSSSGTCFGMFGNDEKKDWIGWMEWPSESVCYVKRWKRIEDSCLSSCKGVPIHVWLSSACNRASCTCLELGWSRLRDGVCINRDTACVP